ncbi:hypothetical protein ABH957_003117 [Bacillus sp. RC242]|uniref:S1 family peptidase n=1 Tax=Bacillus sp. RC242 TaxID=3156286 RepID=UPI003834C9A1
MVNYIEIYRKYRTAMAYIEVQNPDSTIGIGSAFHIGEGVFVTARHVVYDNKILKMARTEQNWDEEESIEIIEKPLFHPNSDIDVAIIRTANFDLPFIEIGGHLDDWINKSFILSKVVVMGYPPIPLSKEPALVTTVAEINGIIDTYIGSNHPQFILSSMARGGFSGGVALLNDGSALGVITESLVSNDKPAELGYFSVLTIEPILSCLAHNKAMPKRINDFWRIEGFEKTIWDFPDDPFKYLSTKIKHME